MILWIQHEGRTIWHWTRQLRIRRNNQGLEIGQCTDRIGNGTVEVIVREIKSTNGRRDGNFGRQTNVDGHGARELVAAQIKKLYEQRHNERVRYLSEWMKAGMVRSIVHTHSARFLTECRQVGKALVDSTLQLIVCQREQR
jgi:hypothetical protein